MRSKHTMIILFCIVNSFVFPKYQVRILMLLLLLLLLLACLCK